MSTSKTGTKEGFGDLFPGREPPRQWGNNVITFHFLSSLRSSMHKSSVELSSAAAVANNNHHFRLFGLGKKPRLDGSQNTFASAAATTEVMTPLPPSLSLQNNSLIKNAHMPDGGTAEEITRLFTPSLLELL